MNRRITPDISHRCRIDDILEMVEGMVDTDQLDIDHFETTLAYGTIGRRTVIRVGTLGIIEIRQDEGTAYPHLHVETRDDRGWITGEARSVTLSDIAVAYMLAGIIEGWIA